MTTAHFLEHSVTFVRPAFNKAAIMSINIYQEGVMWLPQTPAHITVFFGQGTFPVFSFAVESYDGIGTRLQKTVSEDARP